MPYSKDGASWEHITNISSDELAPFDETLLEWLRQQSTEYLAKYQIEKKLNCMKNTWCPDCSLENIYRPNFVN